MNFSLNCSLIRHGFFVNERKIDINVGSSVNVVLGEERNEDPDFNKSTKHLEYIYLLIYRLYIDFFSNYYVRQNM